MNVRALIKVANKLDSLGLSAEADVLDRVIRKIANDEESSTSYNYNNYPWGGSSREESPQGMVSGGTYPPRPPSASWNLMDDAIKYLDQQEKERLFDIAWGISSKPEISSQTTKSNFNLKFQAAWRDWKNRNGPLSEEFDHNAWTEIGTAMADKVWESMQMRGYPSAARPTAPKSKLTDQQRWAAYAKRVPNGQYVKAMWVDQGAGNALAGTSSYDGFLTWLKSMMERTKMTEISATYLVARMGSFKKAAMLDLQSGKKPTDSNSVLGSLYTALAERNMERYNEIVAAINARSRVEIAQSAADKAAKEREERGAQVGKDIEEALKEP